MSFVLKDFEEPVPVTFGPGTKITANELRRFPAFITWRTALKESLEGQSLPTHPFHQNPYKLKSITIQSVDWFGPKPGFVKLEALVENEKGPNSKNSKLPGVVFLRGGSVAMLMILRPSDSNTERWVIMTEQPRIPSGSLRFLEIPAGMIDDNKTFRGAAANEIQEETGLTVHANELQDLTKLALDQIEGSDHKEELQTGMYPSPGGCDEFIAIFLWEKVLERQEIESLKGRLSGKRTGDSEMITVRILPYEDLWKVGARDAKTLAAWSLYEALKRSRTLRETKSW
ncbi:nudix hydrolase 14 [Cadophora sp. MPI-SDFR-AT-0126]|nr:nudix hydrolase 14 [Leotiomycetes sp. MPI-SDFR-AT-0126]